MYSIEFDKTNIVSFLISNPVRNQRFLNGTNGVKKLGELKLKREGRDTSDLLSILVQNCNHIKLLKDLYFGFTKS